MHCGGLDVWPWEWLHGLEWWGLLPLQGLHVSHLVTQCRGARITIEWLFHPDQLLNKPGSVCSNTLCWERVSLCEGRQVSWNSQDDWEPSYLTSFYTAVFLRDGCAIVKRIVPLERMRLRRNAKVFFPSALSQSSSVCCSLGCFTKQKNWLNLPCK